MGAGCTSVCVYGGSPVTLLGGIGLLSPSPPLLLFGLLEHVGDEVLYGRGCIVNAIFDNCYLILIALY